MSQMSTQIQIISTQWKHNAFLQFRRGKISLALFGRGEFSKNPCRIIKNNNGKKGNWLLVQVLATVSILLLLTFFSPLLLTFDNNIAMKLQFFLKQILIE